jgi:ATP synthase protein I
MTTALIKLITGVVYRILFYQLAMIMGLTGMLFLLKDKQSGLSVLAGGLAYWLPTLVFVRGVASTTGARAIARFMTTFFVGEAIKLIASGGLFLLAISYFHADTVYALLGLMSAIVAFWIASIMCVFRRSGVVA